MCSALALALYRLERFEEAGEWALKATRQPNAHLHAHALCALVLAGAGRVDESLREADVVRRLRPGYTIDDYFSDRIICGMATGRPTISWYFPKIENHFLPGKEVLVAHNAQEVIDLVRWCKAHPEEASEIGRNGYEKVSNNNTCYHMIKKLLGILQGK